MKFCTKCGAELFDDAVICTKCGRMLENQPQQPLPATAEPPSPTPQRTPSSFLVVSNFIHLLSTVFVLFFSIVGTACGYVYSYGEITQSFYTNYINTIDVWSYFYPSEGCMVFAFLFAGLSLIFGVISFVLTLVQKHRGEQLFSGISKLLIGLLSSIGTIVALAA